MHAEAERLVAQLRAGRSERDLAGQRRFGIASRVEQLGWSVARLRALARPHRRDHALALALFDYPINEARLLAAFVEDPRQVTPAQMDRWIRACDNWALTDTLCFGVFDRTPHAERKVRVWARRRDEFVRRAAFSLIAGLAVHRKEWPDEFFLRLLPVIRAGASDERNFVRKAVSWALRQLGKRNPALRRAALAEARALLALDTKSARWIAHDTLRELRKPRAP